MLSQANPHESSATRKMPRNTTSMKTRISNEQWNRIYSDQLRWRFGNLPRRHFVRKQQHPMHSEKKKSSNKNSTI